MAYLTAISGPGFGKRSDIAHLETVLGRHPDCHVIIEVGAVSRQHAKIHRVDDEFELEDLGSRNGTFLNGQLITAHTKLHDGDLIRICDVEFSFHREDESIGLLQSSGDASSGSSFGVLMIDDGGQRESSRAVSSKLDIRGSTLGTQLTTGADARLKAVLEISQSLGRAVRVEEVLPKVLDTLFKIFLQADRAFIVLREGEELIARWTKTRQADQQEAFRISRTVMREVMDSKEAIITLDASSDERFEMANSISDFRIRSMVVAPLLDSDGEALGAIQMDTLDSKRHFEPRDLEILSGVAIQAGVAIEKAQMHEQLIQHQRVEQDLELARNVQRAFLPARYPDTSGYDFYHFYLPADQIGGDYYDYIELSDGRLAILVADVVGHGVAAAMLMAKLSAEVRFLLASEANAALAITKLNQRIADLGVEKFVTLLCLVLDPPTGNVEIVNAGHMPPLWLKVDGSIDEPGDEATGVPIGIIDGFEYDLATIEFAHGDRLILYTDGINEAPSAAGDMFGIDRLQKLVGQCTGGLQEAGEQIVADVRAFVIGTEQADDMCLVIVGRNC
ncbi:MAG: SpoIIE family protein phosphatase [Pirellulaceae bacterium]|nr:SpoIIE family protein phosphatase [Pirellulaceae bacterium]